MCLLSFADWNQFQISLGPQFPQLSCQSSSYLSFLHRTPLPVSLSVCFLHNDVNKVSRMDYPDSHGSWPALCSVSCSPLCLLQGIIHLVLSPYTRAIWAHTHRPVQTHILISGKFTPLWCERCVTVGRWETEYWKSKKHINYLSCGQSNTEKGSFLEMLSKCFLPEDEGDISAQKQAQTPAIGHGAIAPANLSRI